MPIESADHIGDLDPLNPIYTEFVREGDDHLRLVKGVVKADVSVEHHVTGADAGRHKFPSGNTASRPAAGATGAAYFNTQNWTWDRDDGANWYPTYGGIYLLAPDPASTASTIVLEPAAPLPKAAALDSSNPFPAIVFTGMAATSTGPVDVRMRLSDNSTVTLSLLKMDGSEIQAGELTGSMGIEMIHYAPGNYWVLLSPTIGTYSAGTYDGARNDFRLVLSGANLTLSPVAGKYITIKDANGLAQLYAVTSLPTLSAPSTAAQLNYIYAYISGGAVALERSTTGYATDTDGYRYKSGDKTRRLVGVAEGITSGASVVWADSITNRLVWSADHPIPQRMNTFFASDSPVAATSFAAAIALTAPSRIIVGPGDQMIATVSGSWGRTSGTGGLYGQLSFRSASTGGAWVTTLPIAATTATSKSALSLIVMQGSELSTPEAMDISMGVWIDSGTLGTVYASSMIQCNTIRAG